MGLRTEAQRHAALVFRGAVGGPSTAPSHIGLVGRAYSRAGAKGSSGIHPAREDDVAGGARLCAQHQPQRVALKPRRSVCFPAAAAGLRHSRAPAREYARPTKEAGSSGASPHRQSASAKPDITLPLTEFGSSPAPPGGPNSSTLTTSAQITPSKVIAEASGARRKPPEGQKWSKIDS